MIDELRSKAARQARGWLALGLVEALGTLVLGAFYAWVIFLVIWLVPAAFGVRIPGAVAWAGSAVVLAIVFWEYRRGRATRVDELDPGDPVAEALLLVAAEWVPDPIGVAYLLFGLPRLASEACTSFRRSVLPPPDQLDPALALGERLLAEPSGRLALQTLRQAGGPPGLEAAVSVLLRLGWVYLARGPDGLRVVATHRLRGLPASE